MVCAQEGTLYTSHELMSQIRTSLCRQTTHDIKLKKKYK